MKTLIMWVVLATPTPQCLADYDAKTLIELSLPNGTTQSARLNNPAVTAPVVVGPRLFIQDAPPEVVNDGCYEVSIGRLEIPIYKPKEPKPVKAKSKASK